jgi:Outer membrane protein beta-barrel domain
MKPFVRWVVVSFLGFILWSDSLSAQNSYAIGIGGGAAIPVGRLKDAQTSGFNGLVSLALGVAELPIGVRIDGIYNRFPRNGNTSPATGPSNTYSLRASGILGNLIFAFPGTSTKAYAIAGGGLYYTKVDVAGAKSERDPGLNAGAGFTFGLGPIASFVEARYHFIRRPPDKGGVIHFVPITLGIMF